jgi:hypothetical protein
VTDDAEVIKDEEPGVQIVQHFYFHDAPVYKKDRWWRFEQKVKSYQTTCDLCNAVVSNAKGHALWHADHEDFAVPSKRAWFTFGHGQRTTVLVHGVPGTLYAEIVGG